MARRRQPDGHDPGIATVIRFEEVGLRYGDGPEILRDISFDIPRGSFHFIGGASGAGKSSLLRLISLSQRPTRGVLTLFGLPSDRLDRRDLPALRRRIGVIFQDFRLIGHLSARDNVALPLRLAGVWDRRSRQYVHDLLRWVGLGDRADALPSTLSGGEQQRVAVARAVIGRPEILLADEPTGNVDDQIGLALFGLFEELNRLGTTVLVATHNDSLIRRHGHPELHLAHGRLHRVPRPLPKAVGDGA